MTIQISAAERLRMYRSPHRIARIPLDQLASGMEFHCDVDGLRVIPVKGGRWRHDPTQVIALLEAEYGGPQREVGFPR